MRYIRFNTEKEQINLYGINQIDKWRDTCKTRATTFIDVCEESCDCDIYDGGTVPPTPIEPQYRWINRGYLCEGTTKYNQEYEQISNDNGITWKDTGKIRKGSLIEENSTDCGYVPPTPTDGDLAFEFEGTEPQTYKINGQSYTATTSPVSIDTKTDLGIETITSMNEMFFQGFSDTSPGVKDNNITKITKIPDTSKVNIMRQMFRGCNHLSSLDVSKFDTSNVTDLRGMFIDCSGLTTLDLSNFNTSNVRHISSIFTNCSDLTTLNLSGWNLSNVTSLADSFYGCINLKSITMNNCTCETIKKIQDQLVADGIRDNVTIYSNSGCEGTVNPTPINYDLAFEFSGTTPINVTINKFVSNTKYITANSSPYSIDTKTDLGLSEINSMNEMFYQGWDNTTSSLKINNITKISKLPDTSKTISMRWMFKGCNNLSNLDLNNFNTINVTNMDSMFQNCNKLTELNLSNFNTSRVTDMSNMFQSCKSLTSLNLSNFDTSNVTNMTQMFYGCSSLTSLVLSGWNMTNVTDMQGVYLIFANCTNLISLDLSGWNLNNTNTDLQSMFSSCTSLKTIYMRNCNQTTVDSIKSALSDSRIPDGQVTIITQ